MPEKKPSKYETLQNQIDELLKELGDLKAVSTDSNNSDIVAKIDNLSKKIDNIANRYTTFETNVKEVVGELQEKVKQFESNEYYLQSQKEQGISVSEHLHLEIEDEPSFESDRLEDRHGNPLIPRSKIKKELPVINMS